MHEHVSRAGCGSRRQSEVRRVRVAPSRLGSRGSASGRGRARPRGAPRLRGARPRGSLAWEVRRGSMSGVRGRVHVPHTSRTRAHVRIQQCHVHGHVSHTHVELSRLALGRVRGQPVSTARLPSLRLAVAPALTCTTIYIHRCNTCLVRTLVAGCAAAGAGARRRGRVNLMGDADPRTVRETESRETPECRDNERSSRTRLHFAEMWHAPRATSPTSHMPHIQQVYSYRTLLCFS